MSTVIGNIVMSLGVTRMSLEIVVRNRKGATVVTMFQSIRHLPQAHPHSLARFTIVVSHQPSSKSGSFQTSSYSFVTRKRRPGGNPRYGIISGARSARWEHVEAQENRGLGKIPLRPKCTNHRCPLLVWYVSRSKVASHLHVSWNTYVEIVIASEVLGAESRANFLLPVMHIYVHQ